MSLGPTALGMGDLLRRETHRKPYLVHELPGTIAIHAGSSKVGINELRRRVKSGKLDESAFPLGAVVGVADIVDCLPLNEQLEEDPWAQGPICWILENARRLDKPIPMKGKLNLFSLPTEVAEEVETQLHAPCRKEEPVDSQLLSCLLDPLEERWLIQMSAYVELNQMDPVLRLANRYISQFPDVGIGYRFRAAAHCHLGDGGAAIADANRAIELDPQDAGAHFTRAMVQFDQGDFVAARSSWERARELGAERRDSRRRSLESGNRADARSRVPRSSRADLRG
jgi:tetratricopeptide (TPR) repeat protein